ncbi:hypothetical protein QUB60_16535 [Microcoleus sp. A2-C5]|uniref:hypothetical protein n=1 Tax=Microcoleaceae TaxID=1892252 RepID=UPI002238752D|nr:hypothetical protein [Lyngbya sp. CCAP 1446/10]MCW6053911.1 hypothetical protein [Lyngbya sp. CCAP 1446/10]
MRNGKGDRSFEPQMHADGGGWGKGRSHFGPVAVLCLCRMSHNRLSRNSCSAID